MNQIKTNIFALIAVGLLFVNCKNKDEQKQETIIQETEITSDEHSSKNSLNWVGTYKGTLPCADCEGIETEIKLNEDNTYVEKFAYLGKKKESKYDESGIFT